MKQSILQALQNEKQDPKDIGEVLKSGSTKPEKSLTGYDFHGTLNTGIKPVENSVVITGALDNQMDEISEYLKKIGREDMKVYAIGGEEGHTAEERGKWKAEKINKLGVDTYYNDDAEENEVISKYSDVKIIPVGDDSDEDEVDKFYVMSTFGELLDVAMQLKREGKKVIFSVPNPDYKKIGDGIVEKDDNWHNYLSKGYIWVIDGCELADLQDWLREQGEYVVGTNKVMSEYENDRQKGQELFKKAGFNQPESHNFTDIDDALMFADDNNEKRWILKQNGTAPKSVNYLGKFEGNEDMLYHLSELKKKWNEHEYGSFDADLMEVVDGVEIACSAFWNGHDWLRNKDGKAVAFLNFEEKKESDGGTGETVGETGTTFFGTDENNSIAKMILFRPEIEKVLKESDYRGVFDINGSLTEKGFVAFEATSRFGIPSSSYEFIAGLKSKTSDLLKAMAIGEDIPIRIQRGWGMVVVLTAKPYPVEADMGHEHTSLGEKLWILNEGKPSEDFTGEQESHVHLENFYKDDEGNYKVATPNGYLLVVSSSGSSISGIRDKIIKFIKDNMYISGQKYRTDIGSRVEENL